MTNYLNRTSWDQFVSLKYVGSERSARTGPTERKVMHEKVIEEAQTKNKKVWKIWKQERTRKRKGNKSAKTTFLLAK